MKKVKKMAGFTLAELLIVVAIIAVLVAISIPVFTAQLTRAQISTDEANIRAAYAQVVSDCLENSGAATAASSTVTGVTTYGTATYSKDNKNITYKHAKSATGATDFTLEVNPDVFTD